MFDILANNSKWSTATAAGKITWGPKASAPKLCPDSRIILLANQAAGNTFKAVHQR